MDGLSENISAIENKLDVLENSREKCISESRRIIRCTKNIIHGIQTGNPDENALNTTLESMRALVSDAEPEFINGGPVQDAMMEVAEAALFYNVTVNEKLPSFEEIGVTPQAWILGLSDCLGEMRRLLLSNLMAGDLKTAEKIFGNMEEICDALMVFDVPDAILPLRRKQDIARGIMEKTRTDFANAVIMNKNNF